MLIAIFTSSPTKGTNLVMPKSLRLMVVVALKPLHDAVRIRRVVVATYQSVSGAGKEGMDELFNQTRAVYVNDQAQPEQFTKPIAFNCIPHIDKFMDDGSTKEEWKMAVETRKILDPDIAVVATCVRVPAFIGPRPAAAAVARRRTRAGATGSRSPAWSSASSTAGSRTAIRLNQSQPAISNSLHRLRDLATRHPKRRSVCSAGLPDPAVDHVGVQPMGQSNTAHARSGLAALGQHLGLEVFAVLTAARSPFV